MGIPIVRQCGTEMGNSARNQLIRNSEGVFSYISVSPENFNQNQLSEDEQNQQNDLPDTLCITIEDLRAIEAYKSVTDQEAREILTSIHRLCYLLSQTTLIESAYERP